MADSEEADLHARRQAVEEQLRTLAERLRREMVARGFDPAQDENLALTAPLARLFIEREALRDELQSLVDDNEESKGRPHE